MRKIVVFLIVYTLPFIVSSQTIYSQTFNTLTDSTISLNSFSGKKILLLIAPIRESDSGKIAQIAAFQAQFPDSVKVIGIVSREDGYADSIKAQISSLYTSRNINIILTAPMYTRANAGTNQSDLAKWLTNKQLNKRFDQPVTGVFQKFFIDENGKLFSVLIAESPLLSASVITNIYRRPN